MEKLTLLLEYPDGSGRIAFGARSVAVVDSYPPAKVIAVQFGDLFSDHQAAIAEKEKRIGDLEESVRHELRRRCQCEFDSGGCFSECRYHGKQTDRIAELEAELAKMKEERDTLKAENRSLEWQIYRPLKEGEITRDGDQVLGPEDDAVWEPVTGNYRPAPSPLYPAHCQYRRPIVDELKKDMESDYFYRKCVAGKESAREKKIKELEAELAKAREEISKRDHLLKARDTLLKEAQER